MASNSQDNQRFLTRRVKENGARDRARLAKEQLTPTPVYGVGADILLAANPKSFPVDRFLSGWVVGEPVQQPAAPSLSHCQLAVVFIIRMKRSENNSAGAADDNPGNDDAAAAAATNRGRSTRHRHRRIGNKRKTRDRNGGKHKFSHHTLLTQFCSEQEHYRRPAIASMFATPVNDAIARQPKALGFLRARGLCAWADRAAVSVTDAQARFER